MRVGELLSPDTCIVLALCKFDSRQGQNQD